MQVAFAGLCSPVPACVAVIVMQARARTMFGVPSGFLKRFAARARSRLPASAMSHHQPLSRYQWGHSGILGQGMCGPLH